MPSQAVKIIDGGKLVIPAQFRRELGIGVGDTVVVELANGELHVRSLSAAIKLAQNVMREYVPDHVNLVDQLIADRRAAAKEE